MEDVLAVYARPHDPRRPVVCNNPIAWAFPTDEPPAVLVDTALTGVKEKIRLAGARGDGGGAGGACRAAACSRVSAFPWASRSSTSD